MKCRVCYSDSLSRIYKDLPPDRGLWWNCWFCGSHVSENTYEQVKHVYNNDYLFHTIKNIGYDGCIREMTTNVDFFQKHRGGCADGTFLDIGCLEGSGMTAMANKGWSVHGFDVIPQVKEQCAPGEHITIADSFKANLFPRKYSAVMAREVIEHVPDWKSFLRECHAATMTNGLFQVQTPRPNFSEDGNVYFHDHLQIFAPYVLRNELNNIGFDVIDGKIWDFGQLWICRKTM